MFSFKHRYRIVSDSYLGYEAQIKRWWAPIWIQLGLTNTHATLELAKQQVADHRSGKSVRGLVTTINKRKIYLEWRD
jgi:hypothetical protein